MPRKHSPFSLLKRGDVYYVRVWDPERKQYGTARSTGETHKGAAAVKAARMIDEGLAPVQGQPLAIDYIIERIENSGNSEKYKGDGIKFINKYVRPSKEFSRLKLSDVQNKHLNRLVDYLNSQGMTGRMVNRVIDYVKPPLKAAYRRGYISKDPTAGKVEKAKEDMRRRGSLTADEIRRILLMPHIEDRRARPYIITAILTGMRKGELRALRWQDVNFNEGVIYVRQSFTEGNGITKPKTEGSVREIPILKPVRDALGEIRESSPYTENGDFVFYQKNRYTPFPSHFSDNSFYAVLDAVGIDEAERERRHLVPHSTRHSFVTFCRALLPDFITAGMSGHTTSQMVDNYGRAGAEHFRTARDVLNAALTVKPEKDESIN
ncbi:MAG: site-specific integrase [Spirochaetes bacterium]|nr:site-specific integrase [Spirochaetota bacterium]